MKHIGFNHKRYKLKLDVFLFANKHTMREGIIRRFGPADMNKGARYHAYCCLRQNLKRDKIRAGLFFHKKFINSGIIAHELIHLFLGLNRGKVEKVKCKIQIRNQKHEEEIAADVEFLTNYIYKNFKGGSKMKKGIVTKKKSPVKFSKKPMKKNYSSKTVTKKKGGY